MSDKTMIKEILGSDVVPALGCTEPIAVAFACSLARYAAFYGCDSFNHKDITKIRVTTDPGVFKNGISVSIPNTQGMKGNLIAAVLGAICGRPEFRLEVLRDATNDDLAKAKLILDDSKKALINYNPDWKGLRIEAKVVNGHDYGIAIINGHHTNVITCRKGDSQEIDLSDILGKPCIVGTSDNDSDYHDALKKMSIADMVELARGIDSEDRRYIREGIEMNMEASRAGRLIDGVGSRMASFVKKGILSDDLINNVGINVAYATDARMAGLSLPLMSSGGSGNQGAVAILVPYLMGQQFGIDLPIIEESIALSHTLNTYVKCFLGNLSSMCNCAVAAGIGASAGIVYQKTGSAGGQIGLAINNVIADITGILCDGAKGGCSMKVMSSVQSSIRAALLAMDGFSIDCRDGILGATPEETIEHLWVVDKFGMKNVDTIVLQIMKEKKREI